MQYSIGRSTKDEIKLAIEEVCCDFISPILIIFFSGDSVFSEISITLHEKYRNTTVIGVTTYLNLSNKGISSEGITAIAFEEGIECYSGIIEEAGRFPGKYVDKVNEHISQLKNYKNCICLEFCAMTYYCEELVLDVLFNIMSSKGIPIFGSSAGSRNSKNNIMISYNGNIYRESCVYVLIKNLGGTIRFYKENIYKPTKYKFKVTDVEIKERKVYEYDNLPAAKVMAKALNTDITTMNPLLKDHPMGRLVNGDIYITEHNEIVEGDGISFFANIYNNTRLVLLEADDYKKVFENTKRIIKEENKKISFAFVVNCLARSAKYEKEGFLEEFGEGLKDTLGQFIGVSGYGEQLNNHHFNQTMIIAIFE